MLIMPTQTDLVIAVRRGMLDEVRAHHKAGLDINHIDPLLNSFVHDACMLGNTDLLKFLLELKLPIDARNAFGKTPIMIACEHKWYQGVAILLESGSNPDLIKLHKCVDDPKLLKVLLDGGVAPNPLDNDFRTPLDITHDKKAIAELIAHDGCSGNDLHPIIAICDAINLLGLES